MNLRKIRASDVKDNMIIVIDNQELVVFWYEICLGTHITTKCLKRLHFPPGATMDVKDD